MFLACTKNMSYLKESPRGSVNTQSFITTFMYLQNESEGGMFRRVASNRRFAGILGERRVSPIDFFRHVDRVNAYSSCQRRAGFASSKSHIIVDRAQIFEYNDDLSNAHNFTAQREREHSLTRRRDRRCRRSSSRSATPPSLVASPRPSAESTGCCRGNISRVLEP